jgi:hypothetical protein
VETSRPPATYRYVSDGALEAGSNREVVSRLCHPVLLGCLTMFGLLLGIVLSLLSETAPLPDHLGQAVRTGVVWGLVWVLVLFALIVLALPLMMRSNRRFVRRLFPEGSLTEVELDEDELVIRRPTRTVAVPYHEIFAMRPRRRFWILGRRGHLKAELLPREMLSDSAVARILSKARGLQPMSQSDDGTPDREFVVPTGWATHVATLHVRSVLRRRAFWMSRGQVAAFLVSLVLAVVLGPWWLVLEPALALLAAAVTFETTRLAITRALPELSLATTGFRPESLVSRNASGVREIRYDEIRFVEPRSDVVFLHLTTPAGVLAMSRDLLPEELVRELTP